VDRACSIRKMVIVMLAFSPGMLMISPSVFAMITAEAPAF